MLLRVLDDLIVAEGFDAPAEDKERSIDVSGLFLTVAGIVRLLDPLGSGKVAERQHRHACEVRLLLKQLNDHAIFTTGNVKKHSNIGI
jgi:hypothetical protein